MPVFDQTGGCSEATFWAVNDEETVGLEVRTVSGSATFSFGVGRSGCADGGYDGTAELSDVTFSDGTHIDSLVVSSTTIGCFV